MTCHAIFKWLVRHISLNVETDWGMGGQKKIAEAAVYKSASQNAAC